MFARQTLASSADNLASVAGSAVYHLVVVGIAVRTDQNESLAGILNSTLC